MILPYHLWCPNGDGACYYRVNRECRLDCGYRGWRERRGTRNGSTGLHQSRGLHGDGCSYYRLVLILLVGNTASSVATGPPVTMDTCFFPITSGAPMVTGPATTGSTGNAGSTVAAEDGGKGGTRSGSTDYINHRDSMVTGAVTTDLSSYFSSGTLHRLWPRALL